MNVVSQDWIGVRNDFK